MASSRHGIIIFILSLSLSIRSLHGRWKLEDGTLSTVSVKRQEIDQSARLAAPHYRCFQPVSEDELEVILNVYLYSSGSPVQEQQHAHVLQEAVPNLVDGTVEPRQLTFNGPKYEEVKTMQVADVTEMARALAMDTLTSRGVRYRFVTPSPHMSM